MELHGKKISRVTRASQYHFFFGSGNAFGPACLEAFAAELGDFESGHESSPPWPNGEMGFWKSVEVGVVKKVSASMEFDADVGSSGIWSVPGDPSSPLPPCVVERAATKDPGEPSDMDSGPELDGMAFSRPLSGMSNFGAFFG